MVLPELEVYTKKHVHQYVSDKFQTEQMPDLVTRTDSGLVPIVTVSRERASLSTFVESANAVHVAGYVSLFAQAVSDDGKTVVLVGQGADYTSRYLSIWDVPSKKEIAKLPGAMGGPPVAFSADGKRVAYQAPGSRLGTPGQASLKVHDLADGAEKAQFECPQGERSDARWRSRPTARCWCWTSAHDLRRLDIKAGAVPGVPQAASAKWKLNVPWRCRRTG